MEYSNQESINEINFEESINEINFDEINTFMKYGAVKRLAIIMGGLFGPIGYSPVTGNLSERVQQADDAQDFKYLSFAMLLKGDTEQAGRYMKRAVEMDPTSQKQTILDNLDRVQGIVATSRADFDELRTRKYRTPPLEQYLI